eukprot:TRINITY_DN24116_c0_g1_i2.p1 TRINITY_DN24116_c0_g1~~TRINITY_DN24116_c0_g1_i2.p1  ORF type:complete len:249 (+),score=15.96 TRINITY_DN24116_c0_g1_i2:97-843(+)
MEAPPRPSAPAASTLGPGSLRDILSLAPPPPNPLERVSASSSPSSVAETNQADCLGAPSSTGYQTETQETSEDDSVDLVLGMADATTGWAYQDDQWTQVPRSSAAGALCLSEFLAMPPDSGGGRMSIGSLGCLRDTRTGCKPCVFNAKVRGGGRACHNGAACIFCHVPACFSQARSLARARRLRRRPHMLLAQGTAFQRVPPPFTSTASAAASASPGPLIAPSSLVASSSAQDPVPPLAHESSIDAGT